jgi:hypothetical protein
MTTTTEPINVRDYVYHVDPRFIARVVSITDDIAVVQYTREGTFSSWHGLISEYHVEQLTRVPRIDDDGPVEIIKIKPRSEW